MVSDKKAAVVLIFVFSYMFYLMFGSSKIFSLSLFFCSVNMIFIGILLWEYILLCFLEISSFITYFFKSFPSFWVLYSGVVFPHSYLLFFFLFEF